MGNHLAIEIFYLITRSCSIVVSCDTILNSIRGQQLLISKIKLSIQGLNKTFGQKSVLKNLDFNVESGEFLSILGPSGCGKTTLLRILIGLEKSDSGSICKDGADITSVYPSKRGMGIVFQNYALFENMTVLQNVEYALLHDKERRKNQTATQIRAITEKTIADVGLSEHTNKRPAQLSGGQQQRVAIARTLAMNPEIILFDEPMSALDVDTRLSLRSELKRIQQEYGSTMIYITHDQEEAFAMSDRIMIMDAGVIHQLDTPERIVASPADDFVKSFVLDNLKIKLDSLIKYVDIEQ